MNQTPTIKLYGTKGSCSLAAHILLFELGLPFRFIEVNLATKKTSDGIDFITINPNGYVPSLDIGDGTILTEGGAAILPYLADRKPELNLAPPAGTSIDRYRFAEAMGFITSELHKTIGRLFANPPMDEQENIKYKTQTRLHVVEKALSKHQYFLGNSFTAADAYMFVILRWAKHFKLPLSAPLSDYMQRMSEKPSVQSALRVEGLV